MTISPRNRSLCIKTDLIYPKTVHTKLINNKIVKCGSVQYTRLYLKKYLIDNDNPKADNADASPPDGHGIAFLFVTSASSSASWNH